MSLGFIFVVAIFGLMVISIIWALRVLLGRHGILTGTFLLLGGGLLLLLVTRAKLPEIPRNIQVGQASDLVDLQKLFRTSEHQIAVPLNDDSEEPDSPEATRSPLNKNLPISVKELTHNHPNGPVIQNQSEKIPDWMKAESDFSPRKYTHWIIVSQRYATQEEAQEELSKRVVIELEKNQLYVESNSEQTGKHVGVYVRLTRENAILRECEVAWPLEIGGFQEKVYQVAWEMRLNPEVINRFHADWIRQRTQQNLIRLSSAFGAITLLLATLTFLLRRQQIQ